MRKNLYEAFTLVEMLIVMGILIILMAVGITAGRYAINRANDVAHQNAADQLYTSLQAYYTDSREFPALNTTNGATLADMVKTGALSKYLDNGAFNGGTAATFYYATSTDGQVVLVCVSKGGLSDSKHLGVYCTGNGFGSTDVAGGLIKSKDVAYSSSTGTDYDAVTGSSTTFSKSNWDGKAWN